MWSVRADEIDNVRLMYMLKCIMEQMEGGRLCCQFWRGDVTPGGKVLRLSRGNGPSHILD